MIKKEFIDAQKDEDTAINILIYADSDWEEIERDRRAQAAFHRLMDVVDPESDAMKALVRMHNNRAMLS